MYISRDLQYFTSHQFALSEYLNVDFQTNKIMTNLYYSRSFIFANFTGITREKSTIDHSQY